jgi:type I restriction enzyme M protein
MLGVVMPHGVLFRGSSEGQIRRGFLEADLVEAVIGLPSNLFYGTGIPAAILVMRRGKPAERTGKVLFVDASREFREGSNQNHLRDEDVTRIAAAVHAFEDVPRYARVASVDEIAGNDFNLNISRYVDTSEAAETIDVTAAVARLREVERQRDAAKALMDEYLRELGYDA